MSGSPNSAFLICNPASEAGTLDTLPVTRGLRVLSREQLQAQAALRFGSDDKVCLATESVLEDVLQRLDDGNRRTAVRRLKDKFAFRELLKPFYPALYYKQCRLEDLLREELDPYQKYVIKPVKGCFGSGVRIVDGSVNLPDLVADIQAELTRNGAVLSSEVLTPNDFLIESYVAGEEYAVDMFYDRQQQPAITNIYHHPMPENPAYLHMLYYTSRSTFETVYAQAREFFTRLNGVLQVSNLPIHAEFKLQDGYLIPIELNPFRFGGMGLGNLGYHALGLNPYQCFIEDAEPDWTSIWQDKDDLYGFFIAYNGAHSDVTRTRPDWVRLRQNFTRIIRETPFDYRQQLAFGILYIEEKPERVPALLQIEFDDYFVPLDQ
jgi:hypothetical protein